MLFLGTLKQTFRKPKDERNDGKRWGDAFREGGEDSEDGVRRIGGFGGFLARKREVGDLIGHGDVGTTAGIARGGTCEKQGSDGGCGEARQATRRAWGGGGADDYRGGFVARWGTREVREGGRNEGHEGHVLGRSGEPVLVEGTFARCCCRRSRFERWSLGKKREVD